MPTAKRCHAARFQPEAYATALGKLLAAAIIVTPLVAMSFPELNHRSGNNAASRRRGLESCGAAQDVGWDKHSAVPPGVAGESVAKEIRVEESGGAELRLSHPAFSRPTSSDR
jgi:hypothetical protein